MKRQDLPRALLLLGMALMIPCYLFTVGNVLVAPFELYGRSRRLLFLLTALCAGGLLLLLRWLDGREAFFARHERAVLACAAAFYFVAQLAMGAAMRYVPITDTEQCFAAAQLLTDTGTFGNTYRYWEYFTRCPHNLGLVYLLSAMFRLCGMLGWADRYMQAVLLNTLLFVPGLLCAARVCRRVGGVKAQTRVLALFATCLPMLYATTELYTDAFGLSFPLIIVYLAMRVREAASRGECALFGVLFALTSFVGTQIRLTSVIAVIACGIWLLLACAPRRTLPLILLTLCAFAAGGRLVDGENERHLTREAIEQRALPILHYIAMGLPVQVDEGYGQYGDGRWLAYTMSFDDPAERDEALRQQVIDRVYYLRYPNRLLHMMSRKNLSTFGDGAFGLGAMIAADEKEPDNLVKRFVFYTGDLYGVYYHLCTALFLAQQLLACLSCAQAIRRREPSGAPLFIGLLGAFLFLCIWETQPRYFFQYQPMLLCAAALLCARKDESTCPGDGRTEKMA